MRVAACARLLLVVALGAGTAACSGDDDDDTAAEVEVSDVTTTSAEAATATTAADTAEAATATTAEAATDVEETTTTGDAGDEAETTTTVIIEDDDDDTNGDGVLDPFCSQADFGGGLVLQIQCELEGLQSEVPDGVTLVPGSLFSLRSSIHRDLEGISGNLIVSRAPDGSRAFVIVFQSDALFASGSAELSAPSTFDGVVGLIASDFPRSAVQVRGHTDSIGDDASNQALSEARAAAVQEYLLAHGVDATEVTTIGFGETQPLALDDTEEGKAFNRRVEVVIRPPTG
jgi:outer membrane protein OmpA-like peptidoglycan-associated protein